MQEITIYLAMDGTVFNYKIDCIEYELKHDLEEYGIKFFSINRTEILDATFAERIEIECDEIPESLLDEIYSYCGATELPKTKGIWVSRSGREINDESFCSDCSYYHNDYDEEKPYCHCNVCHEFAWVKEQ